MKQKPRKSKAVVGAVSNRDRVVRYAEQPERINPPSPGLRRTSPLVGIMVREDSGTGVSPVHSAHDAAKTGETPVPLNCVHRDDAHGIWLYQGNCLAILDAIAAKHPDGCFDMIFADPPYCRP